MGELGRGAQPPPHQDSAPPGAQPRQDWAVPTVQLLSLLVPQQPWGWGAPPQWDGELCSGAHLSCCTSAPELGQQQK